MAFVVGGGGGGKLDPSLKAPRFQKFNLMKEKLAFNLEPGVLKSLLAPLHVGLVVVMLFLVLTPMIKLGGHNTTW